jgi:cysteine-rich repeat protein
MPDSRSHTWLVLVVLLFCMAAGQDATTAGQVVINNPTLENISIEWLVTGDDNADGQVAVRYRADTDPSFRQGHALLRVPAGSNSGFTWRNRHAGSIMGLVPATRYEIELTLTDPDGGDAVVSVFAETRPVPRVAEDATVTNVDPTNLATALATATPGDVLLLASGTYSSFTVSNDGALGFPVTVMGADAATVIVEGEVRMDGRSHVWIMNLTVRGQIKFNSSRNIVVQGCRVETARDGIVAFADGTEDGYFADNTVIGPTVWQESALGANGDNLGEGIVVTGPGNVIQNNRVEGFRDCISLLEDGDAQRQYSIDIIGNDLDRCGDDAIEADFAMGNVRVLRNRSSNSFIAWSSQPGLGGPTYFIRNVAFGNYFQVFKPNRGSLGDILYHNTGVKQGDAFGVYTTDVWGNCITRNNLFIGGPEEANLAGFSTGPGRILDLPGLDTSTSSLDYDGFGSQNALFDGTFGITAFNGFEELRSLTTERNAVQVDVTVFAETFPYPSTLFPAVTVPQLVLAEGSVAVDAGEPLLNVNDGFAGTAPDLGAYEFDQTIPPYGPRTGTSVCGNGAVETGESCDDGNRASGDGCDEQCNLEGSRSAAPSTSFPSTSSPTNLSTTKPSSSPPQKPSPSVSPVMSSTVTPSPPPRLATSAPQSETPIAGPTDGLTTSPESTLTITPTLPTPTSDAVNVALSGQGSAFATGLLASTLLLLRLV